MDPNQTNPAEGIQSAVGQFANIAMYLLIGLLVVGGVWVIGSVVMGGRRKH